MNENLELQRASAGSGKTYSLTKKFLWLFITIKENEGEPKRRLRNYEELRDSLNHILAVTFTNKATNEMQERIVQKLYQLANSSEPINKIDYLDAFCKELFGPSYTDKEVEKLRNTCKDALQILLDNYSDFQVSTIDSFFQMVLRTFAYETGLNDTYSIELDSDFLSQMSVDGVFEDIEENKSDANVKYWIDQLMKNHRNDTGWNIFTKSNSKKSTYSNFIKDLGRLEKEEFKLIRNQLRDYFDENPDFIELYEELCAKYDNPNPADGISEKELAHWKIYKDKFPWLGLISEIINKRNSYLKEINAVELSETNAILSDIIGYDDAPFIYERLGTRIFHYLIDEFQDTSQMQWKNFEPLLEESLSNSRENLLIGDAKQSIYRFRNADATLITSTVPRKYDPKLIGELPADNTNYRSDRRIVDFNNRFFEFLASYIDELIDKKNKDEGKKLVKGKDEYPFVRSLQFSGPSGIYHNVVQQINDKSDRGFISLNIIDSNKENMKEPLKAKLIEYIEDVLSRGFRMGDIAILVSRNDDADTIIRFLLEYNFEAEKSGKKKLEFVSDDSLKLKSSVAVQIILSVLESIARGIDIKDSVNESTEDEEAASESKTNDKAKRKHKSINWDVIKGNFRLYCLKNNVKDPAAVLDKFMNENSSMNAISDMLENMQMVTLPAIIEGILSDEFIDPEILNNDAPYIAAFQDTVLEFCESHTSDIPSFLDWWKKRENKFSITSPEGMDAIRVMTIHKSKGLEFPCVFVPFANVNYYDYNIGNNGPIEWRWVSPLHIGVNGRELPPFIPVEVKTELKKYDHNDVLRETIEMKTMDNINSSYVAFTRAEHELYIFANQSKKDASYFTSILKLFLGIKPNKSYKGVPSSHINVDNIINEENMTSYEIGERLSKKDVEEIKEKKAKKKDKANISSLEGYKSNKAPKLGAKSELSQKML